MPPFTGNVKAEIDIRAGNKSEISGRTDRPLERMHFVHGGARENDVNNGIKTTDIEHLCYHVYFRDNPKEIGLTYRQNEWAINAINQRVVTESVRQGTLYELDDDIATTLVGWDLILGDKYKGTQVEDLETVAIGA